MHNEEPMTGYRRPRVSVLIPVFNTRLYLEAALQSISRQSYADFELVVLDDGSTDGSTAVLEAYREREPRMRLIARENRGLIRTRNELLEAAQGELIAWMDSDDISMPTRLEEQVNCFDSQLDLVCVSGDVECIDEKGRSIGVERYPSSHEEIVAEQAQGGGQRFGSSMMRTALARELGGFREPFAIGEDLDLLLRMSENGRVANLSRTLLQYRRYESSTSSRLGRRWLVFRDVILELARERQAHGSDRLQRGESVVIDTSSIESTPPAAETHAVLARRAIRSRNWPGAWEQARLGLKSSPFSLRSWRILVRTALGVVFRA